MKNKYPSFYEAFWVWVKVALYSFGGPTNQIAVMHKIFVEEKKWISEKRFLHALNYCMLLPGPEAQQLAVYLGWLLHRYRGGLAAGILFVIPGDIAILSLSILYAKYQTFSFVEVLFFGIKAAVIAIVLDALIHIGKKTLKNRINQFIALGAFIGIFFLSIPFPLIIFSAALIGFLIDRYWKINLGNNYAKDDGKDNDIVAKNNYISSYTIKGTISVGALWLVIWLSPLFLALLLVGTNSIFTQIATFFTKAAVVTFGGAYAVLAYISQQSVQYYHWLKPGEMLDGLGMAETLPGPLIKVVEFVGFMAAYRHAGSMNPVIAGIFGWMITSWITFVPAFLLIFTGAPYIEKLRKIKFLHAAMAAITAAVVGVILNLSIWFALHALFQTVNEVHYSIFKLYMPDWRTFNVGTFFIMLCALFLVFRYKANIFIIIFTSILLGFFIEGTAYMISAHDLI